jgi:hypothetical protein
MLSHFKNSNNKLKNINFFIEKRRPRLETKVFEMYEAYPILVVTPPNHKLPK